MAYGELVREHRRNKRITLREFCHRSGANPAEWSKIERGAMPPPNPASPLAQSAAVALDIIAFTAEWGAYWDALHDDQCIQPSPTMTEEELVERLPPFVRTRDGKAPTQEQLEELAEAIRHS